jgi:DNA ligase-1
MLGFNQWETTMSRREFLQLAKKFRPGKDSPAGMWVSEKLDGTRCFWDGGITRGLPTDIVPWANIIDPKTGNRKAKIKPIATGLWSRYGNPIMAPDWWLNQLPAMFLDGELFAGRGNFQTLRSIVAKDVPEEDRWRDVVFAAFGAPTPEQVFTPGEIKNPQFHLNIDQMKVMQFVQSRADSGVLEEFVHIPGGLTFEEEINFLQGALSGGETCYLHQHMKLSDDDSQAEDQLGTFMDFVLNEGGEGIMLRKPGSIWTPKRVSTLLKMKPFTDDQAKVTGFVSGRETDKGSKLRGLIGAVVTEYKGKRLELSGFTNEERLFATDEMQSYAYENPGVEMPSGFQGKHFKVGDDVEFRYRELSDEGIPKEARYFRRV